MSELSEAQVWQRWLDMHEAAKVLVERAATDGEFATPPRTTMAGDDAHLGRYHLTTAFRTCLGAAIDQLHALTSFIVELRRLNIAAPYSLARGTLENASAAFWLIHHPSRDERITRALRWWTLNAHDQDTANVGGATEATVVELIKEIATARGLNPGQATAWPRSSEMVKYADAKARTHAGETIRVLLPWQVCSGFAHGRGWAHMGMLQTETVREIRPGVQAMRLTNSLDRTLWATSPGFHLLAATLRVHLERTRQHLG